MFGERVLLKCNPVNYLITPHQHICNRQPWFDTVLAVCFYSYFTHQGSTLFSLYHAVLSPDVLRVNTFFFFFAAQHFSQISVSLSPGLSFSLSWPCLLRLRRLLLPHGSKVWCNRERGSKSRWRENRTPLFSVPSSTDLSVLHLCPAEDGERWWGWKSVEL